MLLLSSASDVNNVDNAFCLCCSKYLCVLLFSVLTLKALAKDWKARLLLLNLALSYQHELAEHAERGVLAAEMRFVFPKDGCGAETSCCKKSWNIRLRSKSLQGQFSRDKLSSDNSMFAHTIMNRYQAFKGTQACNGYFFRHFELSYKASFHLSLSESLS